MGRCATSAEARVIAANRLAAAQDALEHAQARWDTAHISAEETRRHATELRESLGGLSVAAKASVIAAERKRLVEEINAAIEEQTKRNAAEHRARSEEGTAAAELTKATAAHADALWRFEAAMDPDALFSEAVDP